MVSIAEWKTSEAFLNAVNGKEFKRLTKDMVKRFPHYPALCEVIRS
ncbi:MAG: hypothetical protein GKS07_08460 [Nitrosopumilus sp.]|nr:MAG: hypothetical protein GKS07_08460 [Nitrosopumilus sp.]